MRFTLMVITTIFLAACGEDVPQQSAADTKIFWLSTDTAPKTWDTVRGEPVVSMTPGYYNPSNEGCALNGVIQAAEEWSAAYGVSAPHPEGVAFVHFSSEPLPTIRYSDGSWAGNWDTLQSRGEVSSSDTFYLARYVFAQSEPCSDPYVSLSEAWATMMQCADCAATLANRARQIGCGGGGGGKSNPDPTPTPTPGEPVNPDPTPTPGGPVNPDPS